MHKNTYECLVEGEMREYPKNCFCCEHCKIYATPYCTLNKEKLKQTMSVRNGRRTKKYGTARNRD